MISMWLPIRVDQQCDDPLEGFCAGCADSRGGKDHYKGAFTDYKWGVEIRPCREVKRHACAVRHTAAWYSNIVFAITRNGDFSADDRHR
jgi:hypothetical protein